MAGFPPGQSICTQVDQPSCTYPQLLPSTGRHGGRVAVRKPDKETQEMTSVFLHGNMLLPKGVEAVVNALLSILCRLLLLL